MCHGDLCQKEWGAWSLNPKMVRLGRRTHSVTVVLTTPSFSLTSPA